jgi:hypothetical protein
MVKITRSIYHCSQAWRVLYQVTDYVVETMPSFNHSSWRCAHAGVVFSTPRIGMPILDASWKP